jgi:hypothetical protein
MRCRHVRLIVSLICLMFLLSGCPAYVPWNPLYQGAELDKELIFNIESVGVKISSLEFYCGNSKPRANILIKNFSSDTLRYDFSECTLIVKDMTYAPEPIEDAQIILPPGKSTKRVVSFFMHLRQFQERDEYGWEHPIPMDIPVKLVLGEAFFPDRSIELPSVDYRYPYKQHRVTEFP